MAETIMDEREELMVSAKGGKPTRKLAHFIKPTLSFEDSNPKMPSISLPLKPISLKCTFNGWRNPTHTWISWVDRLHSTYKFTWQKAGIYDAILASRYNIIKNEDLVFGLADRWGCDTNTFVFPWGEASVTLEDVMVLGGYSVLGDSVSGSLEKENSCAQVMEKLHHVHKKLAKGPSQRANQGSWMKHFMKFGPETEIEHEAFLCLWLSRFVFPCFPFDTIVKKFFKIAIGLARGVQIALAPLVLATIYRDLSLLKSTTVNSLHNSCGAGSSLVNGNGKGDSFDDLIMLTLWAPFQLVQVWAWERFPVFRPKPRSIQYGEPRLARWNGVNKEEIGNVRALLQSFFFDDDALLQICGHCFEWRPYCKRVDTLVLPCFYKETEEVVIVSDGLTDDIRSMVRVLRVCELVGMDTIEQYNPHRVAMQFGFDQDIPKHIDRGLMGSDIPRSSLLQLAWISYTNPIRDEILYVPSIVYEPRVTMRYLTWLRQGVLTRLAAFDGLRKKRRFKRARRSYELGNVKNVTTGKSIQILDIDIELSFLSKIAGKDLDMPPNVPPGCTLKTNVCHHSDAPSMPKALVPKLDFPQGFCQNSNVDGKEVDVSPEITLSRNVQVVDVPPGFMPKTVGCNLDFPPGFTPKCSHPTKSYVEKRKVCVSESEVSVKTEPTELTETSKLLQRYGYGQGSFTSTAEIRPGEDILGGESSGTTEQMVELIEHRNEDAVGGITLGRGGKADSGPHTETGSDSDLAARIRKLEQMIAELT